MTSRAARPWEPFAAQRRVRRLYSSLASGGERCPVRPPATSSVSVQGRSPIERRTTHLTWPRPAGAIASASRGHVTWRPRDRRDDEDAVEFHSSIVSTPPLSMRTTPFHPWRRRRPCRPPPSRRPPSSSSNRETGLRPPPRPAGDGAATTHPLLPSDLCSAGARAPTEARGAGVRVRHTSTIVARHFRWSRAMAGAPTILNISGEPVVARTTFLVTLFCGEAQVIRQSSLLVAREKPT